MAEELIRVAKTWVESVWNKFKPLKRMDSVIRDISTESRKNISKKYSCSEDSIFGVFGKDDFFHATKRSESGIKIVQRIAKHICKDYGKVVITGGTIYYPKKGGGVDSESNVIKDIEKSARGSDKDNWRMVISKILANISENAVFILDTSRSASIHEEAEFMLNSKGFCIGVVISSDNVRMCRKHMRRIEIGKVVYYECVATDYDEHCIKPRSFCFLKKIRMNKTTVSSFVNNPEHKLIVVEDTEKLQNVVNAVIQEVLNR